MTTNPHKWFKKRSIEVEVEDEQDDEKDSDIEYIGERLTEQQQWKVKTLDEILQEKRQRLESGQQSPPFQRVHQDESSSTRRTSSSPSEVIYILSPEHGSPLPIGSMTPRKSKLSSQDEEEPSNMPPPRRRKGTEGEEGEILSDMSDTEGGTGKPRRRRSVKSVSQDVEMTETNESQAYPMNILNMTSDESVDENKVEEREKAESTQGSEQSEEESSESESEIDDSSEDEKEEPSNPKEEVETKPESSENEQSSEEESEEESVNEDSGTSEEEEGQDAMKSEEEPTAAADEEDEVEDIHKELLQATDSQKQKERKRREEERHREESKYREQGRYSEQVRKDARDSGRRDRPKHRRRSREEREHYKQQKDCYRRREEKSSDWERRDYGRDIKEKRSKDANKDSKAVDMLAGSEPAASRRYFGADGKTLRRGESGRTTNSRDKYNKSDSLDAMVKRIENPRGKVKVEPNCDDIKQSSGKVNRISKEQSSDQYDSSHSRSSKQEGNQDLEKGSSSKEPQTKSRDQDFTGKSVPDKRDSKSPPRKQKQDNVDSVVLTEQERLLFNAEVVESEDSSSEESASSEGEDEEKVESEEKEPQLPDYLPAVQGCRNVEEFQWLNRIEEGTYGVVYRAKEKVTGDIVALKRLKMEKEKEGFPITSLREINTLLKAQHPNIVHVREIVVGSNMDRIYIVMDYVEHDLKTLMEHMTSPFTVGEVKTLMIQLLRATDHLHDNWILHRDLKTSNLLLNNRGILKVGDFGLAREYGSPLRHYTPIVVTLWYRAPELLLGIKEYSCPIDLWSVGCIFAELLTMKPLFPGRSEIDQINRIFKELGTPSDKIWPGPPAYSELPHVKKMTFADYPFNQLRNRFGTFLTDKGFGLLNSFLTYDPKKRITAVTALKHDYFVESPKPVDPSMFPTWPAKSEMQKRPRRKDYEHSPEPPEGGEMFSKLKEESDSGGTTTGAGFHMSTSKKGSAAVPGFNLKF